MTPGATRHASLWAGIVAASLVLGACGSAGGDPGTATPEGSSSTAGTAWPVTIRHEYGSTTIDKRPERIVSLDLQWTDVLLSMGVKPVAHGVIKAMGHDFPWHGNKLAGSTAVTGTTLPFGRIAAEKPDLIVGTFTIQNKSDYEKLSAIAPTVPNLSDAAVNDWQDLTKAAGEFLGRPDRASAVIDGVDAKVATVADQLRGLRGKTFVLAQYIPGDSIVAVADPHDGSVALFTKFGMKIPRDVRDAPNVNQGRVQVSLERLDLLQADLLILYTNGMDPGKIPGFSSLGAVRSGAVAVLDLEDISGLNTPTPLSIPYELDKIRPALKAAAEAK